MGTKTQTLDWETPRIMPDAQFASPGWAGFDRQQAAFPLAPYAPIETLASIWDQPVPSYNLQRPPPQPIAQPTPAASNAFDPSYSGAHAFTVFAGPEAAVFAPLPPPQPSADFDGNFIFRSPYKFPEPAPPTTHHLPQQCSCDADVDKMGWDRPWQSYLAPDAKTLPPPTLAQPKFPFPEEGAQLPPFPTMLWSDDGAATPRQADFASAPPLWVRGFEAAPVEARAVGGRHVPGRSVRHETQDYRLVNEGVQAEIDAFASWREEKGLRTPMNFSPPNDLEAVMPHAQLGITHYLLTGSISTLPRSIADLLAALEFRGGKEAEVTARWLARVERWLFDAAAEGLGCFAPATRQEWYNWVVLESERWGQENLTVV